jgi:hypothetical protein
MDRFLTFEKVIYGIFRRHFKGLKRHTVGQLSAGVTLVAVGLKPSLLFDYNPFPPSTPVQQGSILQNSTSANTFSSSIFGLISIPKTAGTDVMIF